MKGSGEMEGRMTERQSRDRIAARLMQDLSATGRMGELKVTAPDGSKPMMVAFDHELISAVMERVQWTDGYSNLFVVDPTDRLVLVGVMPAASALLEREAENFSADEVHSDSTIGMLIEAARQYKAGVTMPVRMQSVSADMKPVGDFALQ
jgi:hypothetical protein